MSSCDKLRLIITGASGFIGRNLLAALKDHYQIYAIARRHQLDCDAPIHPNIQWIQLDINDKESMVKVFQKIKLSGGVDYLVHLAAYYDFTGEDHDLYWRTNVDGFKNIIEQSIAINVKRIVFTSSLVACEFPAIGEFLTENSPANGSHIYSRVKRVAEAMLKEVSSIIPSCIIRLPAIFSDCCEYPPLFVFLETWLSRGLFSRILGGNGKSAVPYLHIRNLTRFIKMLIPQLDSLANCEILICSDDRPISHLQLFQRATQTHLNREIQPVFFPKILCRAGLHARDIWGRLSGNKPFERPWMADYIDLECRVDSSRTRAKIGWEVNPRYDILRRMTFMLEKRKSDSPAWYDLNQAAMKKEAIQSHLKIHRLLEKHRDRVKKEFFDTISGQEGRERLPCYNQTDRERLEWDFSLFYRHLMNSILTREKYIFFAYCRDLAEHRFHLNFSFQEVSMAIELLGNLCIQALQEDPGAAGMETAIRNYIALSIRYGIDLIYDVYQDLS